MDTAQWPQEILVKPPSMEDMIPHTTTPPTTRSNNIISSYNTNINNNNNNNNNNNGSNTKPTSSTSLERKVRPQKDEAVNCPRCNSSNTKFCYYNNYSLTQPRYFCKTCRRYWTEGGSLRNIPVGGGSRKNKRSSSSSSSSPSSSKRHHSDDPLLASTQVAQQQQQQQLLHHHHHHHSLNPKIFHHQAQDLNLGFQPQQQQQQHEFRSLSEFMQLPTIDNVPKPHIPPTTTTTTPTTTATTGSNGNGNHLSALELLNGLTSTRGLTPFMPMPVPDPNGVYTSGFAMHDYIKPSLNFSLVDGLGNGYEVHPHHHHHHHHQATNNDTNNNNAAPPTTNNDGRLLFPFEDLKQVSSTTSADHTTTTTNNSGDNHDHNCGAGGEQGDSTPPGYWSGMLGNGGSW